MERKNNENNKNPANVFVAARLPARNFWASIEK